MKDVFHPPAVAERVLRLLLSQDNFETVLGDFAELFDTLQRQTDRRTAQIWYWSQLARSAPSLLWLKAIRGFERSVNEMDKRLHLHNRPALWISLIALIPALLVIVPGIMQSGFGYVALNDALDAMYTETPALKAVISPFILLGGLLLVFVLNAIPALNVRIESQPEGVTSIITFKPRLLHWIFVGTSLLMVGVLLVYACFENFTPAIH